MIWGALKMRAIIYTDGNFRCVYTGDIVGLVALCESFVGEQVSVVVNENGKISKYRFN
jgi:hypothetical protein